MLLPKLATEMLVSVTRTLRNLEQTLCWYLGSCSHLKHSLPLRWGNRDRSLTGTPLTASYLLSTSPACLLNTSDLNSLQKPSYHTINPSTHVSLRRLGVALWWGSIVRRRAERLRRDVQPNDVRRAELRRLEIFDIVRVAARLGGQVVSHLVLA